MNQDDKSAKLPDPPPSLQAPDNTQQAAPTPQSVQSNPPPAPAIAGIEPASKKSDVTELPLRDVIHSLPLAKLALVAWTIFMTGVSGGYIVGSALKGAEMTPVVHEMQSDLDKEKKTSDILQQALAAGNCVQTRNVAERDAARKLIGILDFWRVNEESARHDPRNPSQPRYGYSLSQDLETLPIMGEFADDHRVAELAGQFELAKANLNQQIVRAYSVDGTPVPPEILKTHEQLFDDYESKMAALREYLKAKYLSSEQDIH